MSTPAINEMQQADQRWGPVCDGSGLDHFDRDYLAWLEDRSARPWAEEEMDAELRGFSAEQSPSLITAEPEPVLAHAGVLSLAIVSALTALVLFATFAPAWMVLWLMLGVGVAGVVIGLGLAIWGWPFARRWRA